MGRRYQLMLAHIDATNPTEHVSPAATSLSVRSLDYLIEKGQLRAVKVGRRVLIPSRELERLIEKGTSRVFAENGAGGETQRSAVMHDQKASRECSYRLSRAE
jgi:excisionase family DNA binding protein